MKHQPLANAELAVMELLWEEDSLTARSIREKLYTLSDELPFYSGHGQPSTIGREKATNPFVRA